MRGILESTFEDRFKLISDDIYKFVHILDFSVYEHECEVYEEESAEQREQMDTKLIAHRAIVPTNFLSNVALASSESIHILFIFKRSRFLHNAELEFRI